MKSRQIERKRLSNMDTRIIYLRIFPEFKTSQVDMP